MLLALTVTSLVDDLTLTEVELLAVVLGPVGVLVTFKELTGVLEAAVSMGVFLILGLTCTYMN